MDNGEIIKKIFKKLYNQENKSKNLSKLIYQNAFKQILEGEYIDLDIEILEEGVEKGYIDAEEALIARIKGKKIKYEKKGEKLLKRIAEGEKLLPGNETVINFLLRNGYIDAEELNIAFMIRTKYNQ